MLMVLVIFENYLHSRLMFVSLGDFNF